MTPRYRLHYAPDNASLCVRLALEELHLPYETALVDRPGQSHKSTAYLALNPNGLIPVLETPDGALFETGAILLFLADRHGGVFPAADSPERARALSWLFWLSNTLHPTLRMLFYPSHYLPGQDAALRARTQARIAGLLDMLEAEQASRPLPILSACYAAPMLRWLALYPVGQSDWFTLVNWPRLHQVCKTWDDRASSIAAARAEGLGDTPFSAPRPANPPEGSAT